MALILSHSLKLCPALPRNKFCDGFLIAKDSCCEIPIHRIVLTAVSKRFERIFDTYRSSDSKYCVPDVITFDTLVNIIDFIYTGELVLKSDAEYTKFCVGFVVLKIDLGEVMIKRTDKENQYSDIGIQLNTSNTSCVTRQSKSVLQAKDINDNIYNGTKRKYEETATASIVTKNSNFHSSQLKSYVGGDQSELRESLKIKIQPKRNQSHDNLKPCNTKQYRRDPVPGITPQFQHNINSKPGVSVTGNFVKDWCHKFLISLLQKSFISQTSLALVQDLIDGKLHPEAFLSNVGTLMPSEYAQLQLLAPFLSLSLPYLQYSLARRELSIPGTIPPFHMISQLGYLPPVIMSESFNLLLLPNLKLEGMPGMKIAVSEGTARPPSLTGPFRIQPTLPGISLSSVKHPQPRQMSTTDRTRTPSRSAFRNINVGENSPMAVRAKYPYQRPSITCNLKPAKPDNQGNKLSTFPGGPNEVILVPKTMRIPFQFPATKTRRNCGR